MIETDESYHEHEDDDTKSSKENEAPRSVNYETASSTSIINKLYEINNDPKRKEFLDDLFSFMHKSGSPINRLPIMAKSVLDLYELYNLVVARGGLVDVINKKLWQEIIKGLHLPSSITSAAFTLRTQYMKYLYPYECEKLKLSNPSELQSAIDGNRREGRRNNYGIGEQLVQRNHTPSSLALQLSPLSLVQAVTGQPHQALVNGSAAHTPLSHHPHHPQHPQIALGQNAGLAPEFEASVAEYVKQLQREARRQNADSPSAYNRHASASPPDHRSSQTNQHRDPSLDMLEMTSRMTLWNMYANNPMHTNLRFLNPNMSPPPSHSSPSHQLPSPEPQKEPIDLGVRSSPGSSSPNRHSPQSSTSRTTHKRKSEHPESNVQTTTTTPINKRTRIDEDEEEEEEEEEQPESAIASLPATHIKISNRGDGRDKSMVVSMELNGIMYQGVLFAQADGKNNAASTNNNEIKTSRSLVS